VKYSKAVSLLELFKDTPIKTKVRAENCNTYDIQYISKNDQRAIFLVKCDESYSYSGGHLVSILFEDYIPSKHDTLKPLTSEVKLKCECLTADTKVPLLDGRTLTMEELHEEYGYDKEFWVYSADENGDFVPGKAKSLGITKYTNKVYNVILDNGETIKCTDNHPFMLRDGSYKEAKNLQVGESLMPSLVDITLYDNTQEVISIEITEVENEPMYDIAVEKYQNFSLDAGVVVHNCPAFLYWGSEYIATLDSYNLEFTQDIPPNIRDPQLQNVLCKHVIRVIRDLRGVTFKQLKKKYAMQQNVLPAVTLNEVYPVITDYIKRNRPDINPEEFLLSVDEYTFEEKMLEIGAIV